MLIWTQFEYKTSRSLKGPSPCEQGCKSANYIYEAPDGQMTTMLHIYMRRQVNLSGCWVPGFAKFRMPLLQIQDLYYDNEHTNMAPSGQMTMAVHI